MIMKSNRAQYRRKWVAANRALNQTPAVIPNDNENENFSAEISFHVSPSNSGSESSFDEGEPPPKHVCTSPQPSFVSDDSLGVPHDDVSSSSDDESGIPKNDGLSEGLVTWANKFSIKQNSLDSLLTLLKSNGHSDLPSCARTLLQTPRNFLIQKKSGMDYIYFPLATQLLIHLKRYLPETLCAVDNLEISLNIDGLPLFKSSNKTLWPVLCALVNVQPVQVFPVVLTCGNSKPKDLEFLDELIDDLNELLRNGLKVDERTFCVSLRCIVCDAPARALVKGTKLCSGYFGCDKCMQKGVWLGRVTYPLTKGIQLRSDMSFRRQSNEGHHNRLSPFCNLPIDMVKKFPIDYMHQLCLGVMRKLMLLWIRGNRSVKMSAGQVESVSRKLVNLKPFVPSFFARKPRSLAEIDRWKATEFRQFLLYTGKIALHDILRPDMYEHFLVLSVASSILVCPSLAHSYKDYAKQLLEYFVEQGKVLYGDEFVVYNVHSMIHLADEVGEYGSLDACSSFPFENYMQKLKRLVRSGRNPMVQIAKRLAEFSGIVEPVKVSVSPKRSESAFLLNYSCCGEVVERAGSHVGNGNESFVCRIYEKTEPLFVRPCDSRLVGIHKANCRWTTMKVISSQQIMKKAMKVDLESGKILFMAVLHSYN